MQALSFETLMDLLRDHFRRVEDLQIHASTDPMGDRVSFLILCGKPRLIDLIHIDRFSLGRCMEYDYLGQTLDPIFKSVAKLQWLIAQRMAHSRYLRRRNPRVPRGKPLKRAA